MAEFQFKSGVKTLDVKNPAGELVKTFSINVGNKDKTKVWVKQLNDIQKEIENMSNDENALDQIENLEKKMISSILGADSWDILYPVCENNVFSMLGFVKYLSEFLNEALAGFYKDYV